MTLPIALMIKAQTLVYAASPLFNCNQEQAGLKNRDGKLLFPQDESKKTQKWQRAKEACRQAVEVCMNDLGMALYTYPGNPKYSLSGTIMQQMSLRQAFCESWNEEVIWGNTRQWMDVIQLISMANMFLPRGNDTGFYFYLGVPIKIAELFYSDHGVPIEEDNTWNYGDRYQLRTATSAENLYVHQGSVTIRAHYNREPRFYAWVGFDEGVWYGQGNFDDSNPNNLGYLQIRGYPTFSAQSNAGPVTGYFPKKYIHYETDKGGGVGSNTIRRTPYIWPDLRLSDLLLYYAEAINEADDSPAARNEAMQVADMVRERAGLPTIEDAWTTYSNVPNKYNSQNGLRQIIRQERLIELCFEGKRFFDIRRWKTAPDVYNNTSIQGWNLPQRDAEYFYKPVTIFEQKFGVKDYFFPIAEDELTRNTNLVQNVGW